MPILPLLEAIEKQTLVALEPAVTFREIARINALNARLQRVTELIRQYESIALKAKELQSEWTFPSPARPMRVIRVQVTPSMLKNSMLILTTAIKQKIVDYGETMKLQRGPMGVIFETKVVRAGNKLRERGKIGAFYRESRVGPMDWVTLREINFGRWYLEKEAVNP